MTDPGEQAAGRAVAACITCGRVHPGVGCGGFAPPAETRFRPGQSGNPAGRPKGSHSVREALRRRLRRNPDEDGIGAQAAQLADDLLEAVSQGDEARVRAIVATIHEAEGRPVETVDVTHANRVLIEGEESP